MNPITQPYFATITVGKDGHPIINEAAVSQIESGASDLSTGRNVGLDSYPS
jgi:hypothetical protein